MSTPATDGPGTSSPTGRVAADRARGVTPHTTGIMGTSITSGNRGVLALGASLVNLCSGTVANGKATLLIGNRDSEPACFRIGREPQAIPVVHCRLSPKAPLRDQLGVIVLLAILYRLLPISGLRAQIRSYCPWIRALASLDVVGDVRGGDSFSDIYGMRRFLLGFLMAWTVILVRGNLVQFPQTYGPFKSRLARWMGSYLLHRSSVVVARDKKSREVAQALLGEAKKVLLSPDVAFSLLPVMPERILLEPPLVPIPAGHRAIGLNINGLMYHGGYTRNNMFGLKLEYGSFLEALIPRLLEIYPGELWLIPHTFAPKGDVESDPDAAQRVRSLLSPQLQARVRILAPDYDAHELKAIIGQCEFFVGSRMHACIGALSQGVPCVGVAYSMKFAGVFESVGMEDWVVEGKESTNEQAILKICELLRKRDEVREPLRQRALAAREELQKVFSTLLGQKHSLVDQAGAHAQAEHRTNQRPAA